MRNLSITGNILIRRHGKTRVIPKGAHGVGITSDPERFMANRGLKYFKEERVWALNLKNALRKS